MLSALARGRTNNELAKELGISINTVKFHLRNLYEKLGFRNRSQAIAFYYSHGAEGEQATRVNPSTDDIFRQQLSHGDCGELQLATSLWATQH